MKAAYGDATGHIFLVGAIFAVVALVAVAFVKEVPLRTTVSMSDEVTAAATTGTGAPDVAEHPLSAPQPREYAAVAAAREAPGPRA